MLIICRSLPIFKQQPVNLTESEPKIYCLDQFFCQLSINLCTKLFVENWSISIDNNYNLKFKKSWKIVESIYSHKLKNHFLFYITWNSFINIFKFLWHKIIESYKIKSGHRTVIIGTQHFFFHPIQIKI